MDEIGPKLTVKKQDRPTPETDACREIYLKGDENPYPRLCEDLERRLTVSREALEWAAINLGKCTKPNPVSRALAKINEP